MGRAGRVDELTAEVGHDFAVSIHAHASRVGDVGYVAHLDVLFMAIAHELFHVFRLNHHRHTLLTLRDGEFGGVESVILGGDAVKVYVEAVGELADGHAHASGSEVVRFLNEACHLRAAEQTRELALFGCVAFLHLATAHLEARFRMFLGGTGGSADTVAARASAEHQHHIARHGALAPYVGGTDSSGHSTHFQTLGYISWMINLMHMGGCQPYLVAVG